MPLLLAVLTTATAWAQGQYWLNVEPNYEGSGANVSIPVDQGLLDGTYQYTLNTSYIENQFNRGDGHHIIGYSTSPTGYYTIASNATITLTANPTTIYAFWEDTPMDVPYIDADGTEKTASNVTLVRDATAFGDNGSRTSTLGTDDDTERWYAVVGTVNLNTSLLVLGNARLILCDGAALNITPDYRYGWGFRSDSHPLAIYGQAQQSGTLSVSNSGYAIYLSRDLTINGGYVNSTSSESPGIFYENGQTLIINRGNVTATGLTGIRVVGTLTQNGGTVTATGSGNDTAGIYTVLWYDGTTYHGSTVNINGGTLTANGTNGAYGILSDLNSTVTLGWSNGNDRISASSYATANGGTVKIADCKALKYTSGGTTTVLGPGEVTLNDEQLAAIAGQTLQPAVAVAYTAANGSTAKCFDYTELTGGAATTLTANYDSDDDGTPDQGWYVVTDDIEYTGTLTLDCDVNLILADGKTMSVSGGNKGINADDGSLTIYGQTLGTGTLNATATATNGIGIYTDGIVTINGGTVNATGTSDVGIRGIDGVTINGGTVTTTGIMADGDVTISGGKFTATDDPGISSNEGNVILGWTSAEDYIKADSYFIDPNIGTVTIAATKALHNGSEVLSGIITNMNKLEGETLTPAIVLADNADNTTAIATAATACAGGKTLAVTLQGRKLWKDGAWNTLCLPFSTALTGDLANADIRALSSASLSDDGVLTLNFTPALGETGAVTTLEAGKPYIIKWTRPDGYTVGGGFDITDPVFTGVTISSTTPADNVISTDDNVQFLGTYSPAAIANGNKACLFLGGANTLYWPDADGFEVGAFRAYFQVNLGGGLGVYPAPTAVRSFVLNFGDTSEETGIISISKESGNQGNNPEFLNSLDYYTLDGIRLDRKPTRKGLYIHGGKKVVVK